MDDYTKINGFFIQFLNKMKDVLSNTIQYNKLYEFTNKNLQNFNDNIHDKKYIILYHYIYIVTCSFK